MKTIKFHNPAHLVHKPCMHCGEKKNRTDPEHIKRRVTRDIVRFNLRSEKSPHRKFEIKITWKNFAMKNE